MLNTLFSYTHRLKTPLPWLVKLTPALLLVGLLTACQSQPSSPALNGGHNSARAQSQLQIPPDLVGQTTDEIKTQASVSADSGATATLASPAEARIENDGKQPFLVTSADTDTAWVQLTAYIDDANLPVLSESQQQGVIETDWIGVEGTDTATQRWLRRYVKRLASRPALNNKYTFQLEQLDGGETAIRVSHKQLVKDIIEPKNQHENIEIRWQEKDGDPSRTLDMLKKLQAYMSDA